MNTTKQRTCEERINEHLQSHLEIFETLQKIITEIEPEDLTQEDKQNLIDLGYSEEAYADGDIDAFEIINEYGLSLELEEINVRLGDITIKWCLSWGGPADYFNFTCSKNGNWYEIDEIEYQFQDWYDNATRKLHGDDFELLENIILTLIDLDDFISSQIENLDL